MLIQLHGILVFHLIFSTILTPTGKSHANKRAGNRELLRSDHFCLFQPRRPFINHTPPFPVPALSNPFALAPAHLLHPTR